MSLTLVRSRACLGALPCLYDAFFFVFPLFVSVGIVVLLRAAYRVGPVGGADTKGTGVQARKKKNAEPDNQKKTRK